ncbi:MAG TPA: PIG-L family deacetylase [Acidimicrobiales bacterium]|nr:PIG-L family deacetylase [Acidimicrobiales bacterium]
MSPTLVHVAPHPDDEAVGCPASLLHFADRGWTVVSVISSLGFTQQHERRRRESEDAAKRAGFVPVFLNPPLDLTLGPDLPRATARVAAELGAIVEEHDATVVVSPSPHDVHHGHETVARGVQAAMTTLPETVRWWMWGVWGDLPAPNVFYAFDHKTMERAQHILDAYAGELDRNDYRRMLTGRAMALAVMGSERVFGFGSPAASSLPYAEVLTEVRHLHGRWMASQAHLLDDGPSPESSFTLDLSAWVEAPSMHQVCGWIREVAAEDAR